MAHIGKAWSKCCEADKDRYRDLAAYLQEKYCSKEGEDGESVEEVIKAKPKKKRGMKVLKGMNTEFHVKPKKVISPYIAYVKK
jgi:hypothetical protein